jgi:hypothetical protein
MDIAPVSSSQRSGSRRAGADAGAARFKTIAEHSGAAFNRRMSVRNAALGSFFCNIDDQRAVRCERRH